MRGKRTAFVLLSLVVVTVLGVHRGRCAFRDGRLGSAAAAAAKPKPAKPAAKPVDERWIHWDQPLAKVIARARAGRKPGNAGTLGVVVKKSLRRLLVTLDGKPIKSYVVALGFTPDGGKQRRGDGRTPEGKYYLWGKNPQSRFHLALGVSYPGPQDAARGQQQGLIDIRTRRRIELASRSRMRPPQDTRLGGNIMIHGGGVNRRRQDSQSYIQVRDWTAGCIALRNPDMEELFRLMPVGTTVEIVP